MSKIPKENMTTLYSASESRNVSATSIKDTQIAEVAYAINNAANCGETCVTFNSNLMDEVKQELIDKGYTLTQVINDSYQDRLHIPMYISWKE